MALVSGTLEQLAHSVARDAVRPTRADDDARVHRLNLPAFVDKLDKEAVGVRCIFVAVTPRSTAPPSETRWASRIRWVSYWGRLH